MIFKASVPISTAPAVDPAIIDRSALGYRTNKVKIEGYLSHWRLAFSLRLSDIVSRDSELLEKSNVESTSPSTADSIARILTAKA